MNIKENLVKRYFLLLIAYLILHIGYSCQVKQAKMSTTDSSLASQNIDTLSADMQMPDTSLITYADSMDCNYDQNLQTDEFLRKSKTIQKYMWNPRTKIARGRLINGDSLIASRGGCYSFGQKVRLITKNKIPMQFQAKDWLRIAENISKDFFEQEFSQVLKQAISDSSYEISKESGSIKIEFPAAKYEGMWFIIEKKKNRIEYELGYYTEKKI